MSDPRNVQHDKKVISEKKHHGEDVSKGAEHVVQPGKKPVHEKPHGAHKETEAEKAGGSVAETDHDITETTPGTARVTSSGS